MAERKSVPKPEKKAKASSEEASTAPSNPEEALINIPPVKKKKERRVKTEAEIAAKAERKRLRKEAEAAKLAEKQAKKGQKEASAKAAPATESASPANGGASTKVPKWKKFLKNTADADNAEKLKSVEFDVEGEDDDDSESEKEQTTKKEDKKRKLDQSQQTESNKKAKTTEDASSDNTPLDMSTPGLQYLVEWKKFRSVWKFQKLRQVWLLKHMYDDKELPDTHWPIFLEYIKDLKGAARTATIEEAQKIVDAPDESDSEEEKKGDQDSEMKDADEKEGEEENNEEKKEEEDEAKKEAMEKKRQREMKAARALEVLQLLA
ncbi:hypothetical protein BGW42_008277 [Actinomortierella wolfii]|nr:hypothetical protein BGW42_008277 [Actinomortierella wolfii]